MSLRQPTPRMLFPRGWVEPFKKVFQLKFCNQHLPCDGRLCLMKDFTVEHIVWEWCRGRKLRTLCATGFLKWQLGSIEM